MIEKVTAEEHEVGDDKGQNKLNKCVLIKYHVYDRSFVNLSAS